MDSPQETVSARGEQAANEMHGVVPRPDQVAPCLYAAERKRLRRADLDGNGYFIYPDLVVFARDPNHADVQDKVLGQ